MKVLLVGKLQQFAASQNTLCRLEPHEITHCVDANQAIVEFSQPERDYDWVILDGQAMAGGKMDIAHTIGVMGPHPQTPATCGVEWLENGGLQLHCACHSMMRARLASRDNINRVHLNEGLMFEYHAPCKLKQR